MCPISNRRVSSIQVWTRSTPWPHIFPLMLKYAEIQQQYGQHICLCSQQLVQFHLQVFSQKTTSAGRRDAYLAILCWQPVKRCAKVVFTKLAPKCARLKERQINNNNNLQSPKGNWFEFMAPVLPNDTVTSQQCHSWSDPFIRKKVYFTRFLMFCLVTQTATPPVQQRLCHGPDLLS